MLGVVLLAGLGCGGPESAERPAAEDLAAELAGRFGPTDEEWTPYGWWLTLDPGGTYQCEVLNGAAGGAGYICLYVVGSGSSAGEWRVEDGRVHFVPQFESRDLVVSFADVVAIPEGRDIVLMVDGEPRPMPRLDGP